MRPLARATSPFAPATPASVVGTTTWIRPCLVGEVHFREWTDDERLRQPTWRGLRRDKDPREVVREP